MGPFLSAATGWLLYGALVTATGGLVARWIVARRVSGTPPGADVWLLESAARITLVGAALLPVALALVFVRQLLAFRDPFVPWTEDAAILLGQTAWGDVWLWGLGTSLVAVAFVGLAARGSRGSALAWWVGGAAVLGLGVFPALTGHASGTEGLRWMTIPADTLHVWSAGGWIGGLTFVIYSAGGWANGGGHERASLLPQLVPAFSPVAIVSVAVLVASGTVGAWVHLGSVSDLVLNPYGRLMSLKLIAAALALGLGFINWRRLTPRLDQPQGQAALSRAAAAELLVIQVVLLLTAILVVTPPPMG